MTEAALLIPVLLGEDEPRILLTLRPDHMRTYPGKIVFPGGKKEPKDESLKDTALREAREEVGMSPEIVSIRAVLTPYSQDGMRILPFVGVVPRDKFSPCIRPTEVERCFMPTVASLRRSFCLDYNEKLSIDGITAEILNYFLSLYPHLGKHGFKDSNNIPDAYNRVE